MAHPFPELLLEEGTYDGHDDTDVPGLVQKMNPLERPGKASCGGVKIDMTVKYGTMILHGNQGMCYICVTIH